MRLTPIEHSFVKTIAQATWGEHVKVTLFGSRLHDHQRGGDLDLYVETAQPSLQTTLNCKIQLQTLLDIPVDLIVKPYGDTSPIALIAKSQGILL